MSDSTVETDVDHMDEEATYGIFVKDRAHYEFFREAFTSNKLTFKSLLAAKYANDRAAKKEEPLPTLQMTKLFDISSTHDVFFVLRSNAHYQLSSILADEYDEYFYQKRQRIR